MEGLLILRVDRRCISPPVPLVRGCGAGGELGRGALNDGSPRNWFETPDDDTARIVYHATDPRFMTRR
jgi:hypothetical protein